MHSMFYSSPEKDIFKTTNIHCSHTSVTGDNGVPLFSWNWSNFFLIAIKPMLSAHSSMQSLLKIALGMA